MVDVVVPVAIHQRTLDEAFAKENIHSYICAAFLTAHIRVVVVQVFCCACHFPRAIFPTTLCTHFHRLALVCAAGSSAAHNYPLTFPPVADL